MREYRSLMAVKEFANVMRDYTCQDRQSETNHAVHLLSAKNGGRQKKFYSTKYYLVKQIFLWYKFNETNHAGS